MTLFQAHLRSPVEPLQISYPRNFSGQKSVDRDASGFHISTKTNWYTEDEIRLVETVVAKLPYKQQIVRGQTALTDADDPLFEKSHDELDKIEQDASLPNTRKANGGERQLRERVYIIREYYQGNGGKLLMGADK